MKTFPFSVNDPEIRMEFLTRFLPEAIETLDGDARPSWGKMTPQHMVEHLAVVIKDKMLVQAVQKVVVLKEDKLHYNVDFQSVDLLMLVLQKKFH